MFKESLLRHLTQLNELLKYVESHLTEEINSKYIKQKLNLPYETLSRLFSSLTGMRLNTYFKYRKLSEAAKDIIMTDDKIITIAFKYGYESSESFSSAFKDYHGVSPIAVKKGASYKTFIPIDLTVIINGCKDIKVSFEKISTLVVSAVELGTVEDIIASNYDVIKSYTDLTNLLSQELDPDSVDLYEMILPNAKGVPVYYLGCQRLKNSLENKLKMHSVEIPNGEYMVFEIQSAINKTIGSELRYILDNFFVDNNLPYHPIQIGYYKVGDRESDDYIMKMYVGIDVESKI